MTIKTERLLARAKKIAKKGNVEEAKKISQWFLRHLPITKKQRMDF